MVVYRLEDQPTNQISFCCISTVASSTLASALVFWTKVSIISSVFSYCPVIAWSRLFISVRVLLCLPVNSSLVGAHFPMLRASLCKNSGCKLADKKTYTKLIFSDGNGLHLREGQSHKGGYLDVLFGATFETKWNLLQFQIFYLFLFKHEKNDS